MDDDAHPETGAQDSVRNGVSPQLPSSGSSAIVDSRAEEVQLESNKPASQEATSTNEIGHDSGSIVATIIQRQMPSRSQIVAAIMESSRARARQLTSGETLDAERPFSVFSRIEVEKIKVKHQSGRVTLQLSEMMCAEDGRILPARTIERELSISRPSNGTWVIADPQDRTYLAKEQALEIFQRQAELFLQQAPNSSNTRIIVKALDRLYDQQPDTPQRAAIR
jgi:hypothetical protein